MSPGKGTISRARQEGANNDRRVDDMDRITKEDLQHLLEHEGYPSVSIYMPTQKAGTDVQQNRIRLKNILRRAEEQLAERGIRRVDAEKLLEPAWNLINDSLFWSQQQDEGFAAFIANGVFQNYTLPQQFEEGITINRRFYVKPLFPVLRKGRRFFILAISQKQIRLFEATKYDVRQIELEDVPLSLAEALRWDEEEEFYWYRSPGPGGKHTEGIFHGHSEFKEQQKDRIRRFFHKVDAGLREYLADERAPLVLAGVDYIQPIFREASEYQHLVDDGITGNPEELRPEVLHEKAWKIVAPVFEKEKKDALDQYYIGEPRGLATNKIEEIVPAAFYGRVENLFVNRYAEKWGRFIPETGEVVLNDEQAPENEDLYDFAAAHTFQNRGLVITLNPEEVPGGGDIAATMRYP